MKKFITIMLVMVMLLTLGACKDSGESECSKHRFSSTDNRIEKEATCTEEGVCVKVCKKCGYEEKTAIPKKEHTYEEMIGGTATCTEEGEVNYKCSACGDSYSEISAPKGHKWERATCQSPKTCSVCGISEGTTAPHSWGEANCLTPKTCITCGITEGGKGEHEFSGETCSLCGKENTKILTVQGTSIKIKVPNTITLSCYSTVFKISIEKIDSSLNIWYSVECISRPSGYSLGFDFYLYDPDGYVIASGSAYSLDLNAGEKARDQKFKITSTTQGTLYGGNTYTLKLMDQK